MDIYDGAAWTEMDIDTEADHFEKCQFVRSGSICAISPRSPATFMMVGTLRF
jgi:hypothetical protein